jgi:cytochrome c-type biogenesis protein CcmH
MTQLYASTAIGTAATLIATILFLLRAEFHGRRPVVALTRRWVATSSRTSAVVLVLLFAVAACCFARIAQDDRETPLSTSALDGFDAHATQGSPSDSDDNAADGQELTALRAYADGIAAEPSSTSAASSDAKSVALPDVDTMIAKLLARLEKEPNDVKGWKMLGWSYLNTGRPGDAVTAYQTALKLEPGDIEIKKALDAVKSARTPAIVDSTPADPSSQPND